MDFFSRYDCLLSRINRITRVISGVGPRIDTVGAYHSRPNFKAPGKHEHSFFSRSEHDQRFVLTSLHMSENSCDTASFNAETAEVGREEI